MFFHVYSTTAGKAAINAQEESTVVNRPVTKAVDSIDSTFSYFSREVCVRSGIAYSVRYSVVFQKGFWLQCSYGVDLTLKYKIPVKLIVLVPHKILTVIKTSQC